MSCSPHKLAFEQPLLDVRMVRQGETRVSESQLREAEEQSFREGFEAGQKSMGEQLVKQRAQLLELQRGVFSSLSSAVPELVARAEDGIVKLALACAVKIVAGTPISVEMVEASVREALQQLQGINQYTVVLHPDDLALLRQIQSSVLPPAEDGPVRLVADESISRAGCIIKTAFGEIDARREKKQEKLSAVLSC